MNTALSVVGDEIIAYTMSALNLTKDQVITIGNTMLQQNIIKNKNGEAFKDAPILYSFTKMVKKQFRHLKTETFRETTVLNILNQ